MWGKEEDAHCGDAAGVGSACSYAGRYRAAYSGLPPVEHQLHNTDHTSLPEPTTRETALKHYLPPGSVLELGATNERTKHRGRRLMGQQLFEGGLDG